MKAHTLMRAVLSGARAVVTTDAYTLTLTRRRVVDEDGDEFVYVYVNDDRVMYMSELADILMAHGNVTVSISPDLGAP
jgi:hypothetical protein